MKSKVLSPQNSVSEGNEENSSHSLESWKKIEDLIFQVSEESITEVLVIIQNEFSNISIDSLLNLIIYVSNVRPFAFKLLGNLFQKLFISKDSKFQENSFTQYLYSLGILLDSNFYNKPDNICIADVYENIFQVGSLSHSIFHDNLEEVSFLSASFDIKEYRTNIFKKSIIPINLASFCGSINIFKYLLINCCDITSLTSKWSIKGGHYNIIQLIEQNGHSFDDHLIFAIKYHHHHLFYWLINHYKSGYIFLQNCIKWWNTTSFEYFIHKSANIESKDNTGFTPLIYASHYDHFEVVKYLINKGANIESRANNGWTSLFWASVYGHFGVVKYLIDKGVNIESKDNDGLTPLIWASLNGHFEVVKYLIDKGANIESRANNGCTPLIWASSEGHLEVVKYLIDKGVNIESKDDNGWTPLIHASQNGHFEVVIFIIDKGANIESRANNGWTPLIHASSEGHLEVVKYLIDKGVNIESKDNDGLTPLSWASLNGRFEVVKYLIDKGANIESKANDGWTPLIWASSERHFEVVKYLIDKGAIIESKDNDELTPFIFGS